MQVAYPYRIDGRGRTAVTGEEQHVRDMIEQILFTVPGERVNRPAFGSGLLQLVFAPNSQALAATLQASVQGSLQQWLGDAIEVGDVDISAEDSALRVTVSYRLRSLKTISLGSTKTGLSKLATNGSSPTLAICWASVVCTSSRELPHSASALA